MYQTVQLKSKTMEVTKPTAIEAIFNKIEKLVSKYPIKKLFNIKSKEIYLLTPQLNVELEKNITNEVESKYKKKLDKLGIWLIVASATEFPALQKYLK